MFVGWGGARRGTGPKRRSARSNVAHRPREAVSRELVAHVTLRLVPGLPSLRNKEPFEIVLAALTATAFGLFVRIVEFSVQKTHIHLIIEAADSASIPTGIKALTSRIAKRLNLHMGRHGRVFADRFHLRAITSPREARNALVYVLGNARKHAREAGVTVPSGWIDPRSSNVNEGA